MGGGGRIQSRCHHSGGGARLAPAQDPCACLPMAPRGTRRRGQSMKGRQNLRGRGSGRQAGWQSPAAPALRPALTQLPSNSSSVRR